MQAVLTDSHVLVGANGELLMISSTLAEPEIYSAVPSEMSIDRVVSRSVPFDIEATRDENELRYVEWLQSERGLQVSLPDAVLATT